MNNKKKILSVVLALILTLSTVAAVPSGAVAARVDPAASGDADQYVYTDKNGNEYIWEDDLSEKPEIVSVITEVHNVSGELVLPLYLIGYKDDVCFDGGDKFYFADSAFDTVDTDFPITSIDFSQMYSNFGVDRFMDHIDHFKEACPALQTVIGRNGAYEIEHGSATPDEADSNESYIELNGGRLYYSDYDGYLYFTRAEGITGDVEIPDHINGKPLVYDRASTMIEDCPELTSLTIPAEPDGYGVLFYYIRNCPKLKTITFLDEHPSINGSKIKNCPSLERIDTPNCDELHCENGLLYDGSRLVLALGKSGDFTIPSDVTVIEEYAFSNCPDLSSVTIPASVTKWVNAFAGQKKLKEATVCKGVTNIDSSAFQNCTSLEKINIPDSAERIGYWAFLDCVNLKQVNIPSSVNEVPDGAFMNTGLSQITLLPEVTTISDYAFGDPFADREKNKDFTIKGMKGSAAEEYATKWGFTFVPLSGAKLGDADGDGEITPVDATLVQRFDANMKISVDEAALMCADVDGSGTLDVVDSTLTQRYLANIAIPYPIGQLC
ncbi:leucine-rich repeat protein [Ruminococcus difficilis]|uniref:Leucine-rich repeat protein n=1 Tax=Ruminococcus difficilis TaxID=2763069 RepID=A0A934WU41_9FIRM|nr:leucine-rich repeat protein [Ruminococcus difficilis]MBK6089931.1 leucine-rich repeat protein [Ruminococcus difficilis]